MVYGTSYYVMVIIYRFTPSLKVINMLGSKEEREEKRLAILEQVCCDTMAHVIPYIGLRLTQLVWFSSMSSAYEGGSL